MAKSMAEAASSSNIGSTRTGAAPPEKLSASGSLGAPGSTTTSAGLPRTPCCSRVKDEGIGIAEENLPRLKEMIDECIEKPIYREAREKARREVWSHEGEGAVRTADYLIRKVAEVSAK